MAKTIAPNLRREVFDRDNYGDEGPDAARREYRALVAVARLAESCVKRVWLEMNLDDQDDLDEALERALRRLRGSGRGR